MLIVALPGPNDEVRSSLDILIKGLKSTVSKHILADDLAENLRIILHEKMNPGSHEFHRP